MVQAIWSASVPDDLTQSVVKPLYSDAGSGIVFNLGCEITIGDECLSRGVFLLPTQSVAQSISIPAGAIVTGIRFHPAAGRAVWDELSTQPIQTAQHVRLSREDDFASALYALFDELTDEVVAEQRIDLMRDWCELNLDIEGVIPTALEHAFTAILCGTALGQLDKKVPLSQRQIERLFNTWLGMTPKYYQRIVRVRSTIETLRQNPQSDLAELAIVHGFSDQAHMTREFKHIALVTPRAVVARFQTQVSAD